MGIILTLLYKQTWMNEHIGIGKKKVQIYDGPVSLSHDIKIWPILFSCENISHINTNIHLTASLQTKKKQKVHVGCQYSRTCLKQPLKKRQNKYLNKKNGTLMKVERIAECSPWSILQYF